MQEQQTKATKERLQTSQLANGFAEFKLPENIQDAYNVGIAYKMFGPINKFKLFLFVQEQNINNDDIDYYMAIPPKRQEDELYDDYKNRMRFSKFLLKYRANIYNHDANLIIIGG